MTFADVLANRERYHIECADVMAGLAMLPPDSVQCCVTSPPYFGLRSYLPDGDARKDLELGSEPTIELYLEHLVAVFREVRRVLRKDGTLWLNMGDSYRSGGRDTYGSWQPDSKQATHTAIKAATRAPQPPGLKPKDLCMMPARLALALQADGWWLRSVIIWAKPNPMPESVTDRPTTSHEYIYLLAKSERYFYDADAVREPHLWADDPRNDGQRHTYADCAKHSQVDPDRQRTKTDAVSFHPAGRNKRTVWTVSTESFEGAHFATFPTELVKPCIRAGSRLGDAVLDPFSGAGTTVLVALREGRRGLGIELNPKYVAMSEKRIQSDAGAMCARMELEA